MINGLRSRYIARLSILIFLAMNGVADLAHHHDASALNVARGFASPSHSTAPNHPLSGDDCPICQYLATAVSLPTAPTGLVVKPVAYEFENFSVILHVRVSPRSVLSSRAPPFPLSLTNASA